MILVDTGPLVALFDPRDARHSRCRRVLKAIREPLSTTVPVLTETFHMLTPGSLGANRVRDSVTTNGLAVWFMDRVSLERTFELRERYADHPMDLADASLIVATEALDTRKRSSPVRALPMNLPVPSSMTGWSRAAESADG